VAVANGATGVKVNGAGGDGGSLTLLAGPNGIGPLLTAVEGDDPRFRRIPVGPARQGLQVRTDAAT